MSERVSLEEQASMEVAEPRQRVDDRSGAEDDRLFLLAYEYEEGDSSVEVFPVDELLRFLDGNEKSLYYSGEGTRVTFIGEWLGRGNFREMRLVLTDADVSPDLDDYIYRRYELEYAEPWKLVHESGQVYGRFPTRERAAGIFTDITDITDPVHHSTFRVEGPERPGLGFTLRIDGRA